MDVKSWYAQLNNVKAYLIQKDPTLKPVFDTVDASGFQLHTAFKQPYPALIGAIIGQKISYTLAKKLRGELYKRFGPDFTPQMIYSQDLSFIGGNAAQTIQTVTEYILTNNVDLSTDAGLLSLLNVKGIGRWTIDTTLLTSLGNRQGNAWDIFPVGDKFIQTRMKRLYGINYDVKSITEKWAPYRSVVTWYLWRWF